MDGGGTAVTLALRLRRRLRRRASSCWLERVGGANARQLTSTHLPSDRCLVRVVTRTYRQLMTDRQRLYRVHGIRVHVYVLENSLL